MSLWCFFILFVCTVNHSIWKSIKSDGCYTRGRAQESFSWLYQMPFQSKSATQPNSQFLGCADILVIWIKCPFSFQKRKADWKRHASPCYPCIPTKVIHLKFSVLTISIQVRLWWSPVNPRLSLLSFSDSVKTCCFLRCPGCSCSQLFFTAPKSCA